MDVNTHLRDAFHPIANHRAFNYQFIKLGVFAKLGWTYIAVNFKTNVAGTESRVWMYMANHDQCTTVSETFTIPGPIVEDGKFALCVGGTAVPELTNPYDLQFNLKGLINELYFLANDNLERYHAMDAFGFQCHDYCQICTKIDQPKCLEDFEDHVIHYWDFAPFRWVRPVWDYGFIRSHIGLGIPMDGQGLYAHHNGMWFQGRTLVTPPSIWNLFSFSVDVWFKYYDAVGGMLIESITGAPFNWQFETTGANELQFTLNGNTQTVNFNFVNPIDFNKWFIAQASVARISLTETQI